MPIDPDLYEAFDREIKQLNPALHLPQPEEAGFDSAIDEISALDPDLAQRIVRAVPDPDADAVRGVFGGAAKKGLLATVAGNVSERTQGKSVRGQLKVRPMTLAAGGLGVLALAIGVTALMPEKQQGQQTAQVKTVAVEGQPVAEAHPPQVVKPEGAVSVNPSSPSSSSPSAAPPPESGPAPITPVTPDSSNTYSPAPAPSAAPTPVYPTASSAPVSPPYTPVVTQRTPTPTPIQSSPVRITVPESSPPVSTPKSLSQTSPQVVALPTPVTSAPVGLVTAQKAASSETEAPRRGVISSPAPQQTPRQAVVSTGSGQPQAPRIALTTGVSTASNSPETAQRPVPTALVSTARSTQDASPSVAFVASSETQAAPKSVGGLVSQNSRPEDSSGAPVQTAVTNAPSSSAPPSTVEPLAFTSVTAQTTGAAQYQPGVIVPLTLDTGVAVYPSAKNPVWAHGPDGSIWRGEAALNDQADRIMLTFTTVMVAGKATSLNAYAEGTDGPGIGGHVRPTARNAAQTAINALLGATSSFVQSQTTQTTTYTSSGLVMQSTQPQPNFWLALGGGLAKAFTVPQTQSAVVPFGQLRVGDVINVRVDLASGPVQASVQ